MILYLAIFTIIISLSMAINNYSINKNALLLAGIFLTFASYSLTHYFTIYTNNPYYIALFYSHFTAFWFLPGPLLYFYVRNTLSDVQKLKPLDALHFIPFLVHTINMLPYFLKPFSYKLYIAHLILQDFNNLKFYGGGFLYGTVTATLTRPILVLIYCILSAYTIFKNNPKRLLFKQNRQVISWLILLISTISIVVISYFTLTLAMSSTRITRLEYISFPAHLIAGIAFFILPTSLLIFFPQILFGMPTITNPEVKTGNKRMNKELRDPLELSAQNIDKYIRKEKPYLNPDFDLIDISNKLGLPKHHIAYCFSEILAIKFTTYRSQMRVAHAKKLLESGKADAFSIDGIGQQSGFPSRSTYYATFKAETGMTPNQYLEQIQNS